MLTGDQVDSGGLGRELWQSMKEAYRETGNPGSIGSTEIL